MLSRCLSKIGLSAKKVSNQLLFSPLIGVYISDLVRTLWANAGEKMVREDFCGTFFFCWIFCLLLFRGYFSNKFDIPKMSKHRLILSLIFVLKIFPQALLIRPIENFSFYYKNIFSFYRENVKKGLPSYICRPKYPNINGTGRTLICHAFIKRNSADLSWIEQEFIVLM